MSMAAIISPLYVFKMLRKLSLNVHVHHATFDDGLVENIAVAFRHLQDLELSGDGRREDSLITLLGLHPLQKYCPNLSRVCLPISSSSLESAEYQDAYHEVSQMDDTSTRPELTLRLGNDMSRPQCVAHFLKAMFPNLVAVADPRVHYWVNHTALRMLSEDQYVEWTRLRPSLRLASPLR
ncbi:hypothetical protein BV25DRAFT_1912954 [Artomyces pyxidatus]|uniref:Uncharacterized protein n=1 Tax=Artomyces pyxidatus TaxID=48021 RepID=A0ACB8TC78_9AGAM|nr:hypothetical protein BV25DRAFT_1912954 [Artomyces pyxidatus]